MSSQSVSVSIYSGAPTYPSNAIEVDIGGEVPVAFTGVRRVICALEQINPGSLSDLRTASGAEWNRLFPESPVDSPSLFELADAPNQRRLFRESEQTFRVLNFFARVLVEELRTSDRPIVLRNSGACDLVSLRGIMHATEYARLQDARLDIRFGEWESRCKYAATIFAGTRMSQGETLLRRMRATFEHTRREPISPMTASPSSHLEGTYLASVLNEGATMEHRLAAVLLASRACFFSTNYEGAALALETGLKLLDLSGVSFSQNALISAWETLDQSMFDIPMIELDRTHLGDAEALRSLIHLHLGVVCAFTGQLRNALDSFGRGLECRISPEAASDLRMYRALTLTKRMEQIVPAQREIEAGLAVLKGRTRAIAGVHEAWLRNLYALTYFQERKLDDAREQENLAVACIDDLPGPSATHLKTNLISNFSVLFEAKGDFAMAKRVWRTFEPLNEKLGSDNGAKVYFCRLGALQYFCGETDEAISSYQTAFERAESTGDLFHGGALAGTLGRIYLERKSNAHAERWYERAAHKARAIGDCLEFAKALSGSVLATSGRDFSSARASLERNSTYDLARSKLADALRTDDAAAILAALPLPKGKMSRPFDLVNL